MFNLTVPYSDYNSLTRTHALKLWQLSWISETQNKLHAIESRVNVLNLFYLHCRDEIIIHRLRIGTHVVHLLRRETPHWCLACQVKLIVEHILLHCVSFTNACSGFLCGTSTSMSKLFSKIASPSIIDFIKETGFYRDFKACFLPEFQLFPFQFFSLYIIYPLSTLHCFYMLHLSFLDRFLSTPLFQIILTCLICYISTILVTTMA